MHFDIVAKQLCKQWKICSLFFWFSTRIRKEITRFLRKQSIFCYICKYIFSLHKYVTCQFSNGMHRAAILTFSFMKNLIVCVSWSFIHPLFPETHIPGFTIMPYSCHCYLAAPTFASNYFQEWNTLRKIRTKISDEHLENSLRSATTTINPDIDILISQIQYQTSH